MSMEISEHKKLAACLLMDYSLFRSINGRVQVRLTIIIYSIEIHAIDILSPVPSSYSIRIKHWNYFEYKVL